MLLLVPVFDGSDRSGGPKADLSPLWTGKARTVPAFARLGYVDVPVGRHIDAAGTIEPGGDDLYCDGRRSEGAEGNHQ
jgi:hypothetical protein